MSERHALGLDFGTNTARALIVRLEDGTEVGSGVAAFESGEDGILLDSNEPLIARQRPSDWLRALEAAVAAALRTASAKNRFDASSIVGIGLDATASTPLPVDAHCRPLADTDELRDDLAAQAWLWKDHSAHAEADEITALAATRLPEHLARCGGAYTSEWYFSKLLRCVRTAPHVMSQASAWIESADWLVAQLTGVDRPGDVIRNACCAGHKGLWHEEHGLPPESFLEALDARLADWCRGKLHDRVAPAGTSAGGLSPEWAQRLGLAQGTTVSVAAIDAHVGAVGAGIRDGVLAKVIGTSSCDLVAHPLDGAPLSGIEGLAGVVRESILPGHWGIEAGQAAVGDIFGWFTREFGRPAGLDHDELTRRAAELRPGECGLLALDWHNGNRSVLADPLLSGLVVGMTLRTSPAEVYRALIEATAFGFRRIVERIVDCGARVESVVLSGGVADKNALLRQIYSDVTGRPLWLSRATQTCALGAALLGAVAAGVERGGFADVDSASAALCARDEHVTRPDPKRRAVYDELYALYRTLHDAFGAVETRCDEVSTLMRRLGQIRDTARAPTGIG